MSEGVVRCARQYNTEILTWHGVYVVGGDFDSALSRCRRVSEPMVHVRHCQPAWYFVSGTVLHTQTQMQVSGRD
jgi:hypothetical protein